MAQKTSERDKAIKSFTAAVKQFNSKKYPEAVEAFKKIAGGENVAPDIASKAVEYLQICDDIQAPAVSTPRTREAKFDYATIMFNDGELEKAEKAFGTIKENDLEGNELYLLALINFEKEEVEEGTRLLTLSIEKDPNNRIMALNNSDLSEIRKIPEIKELLA